MIETLEISLTIALIAYVVAEFKGPLGIIAKVKAIVGGIDVLWDALNCSYCLAFWIGLGYGLINEINTAPHIVVSFLVIALLKALVDYSSYVEYMTNPEFVELSEAIQEDD